MTDDLDDPRPCVQAFLRELAQAMRDEQAVAIVRYERHLAARQAEQGKWNETIREAS